MQLRTSSSVPTSSAVLVAALGVASLAGCGNTDRIAEPGTDTTRAERLPSSGHSTRPDLRGLALQYRIAPGAARLVSLGDIDGLVVDWGFDDGEESATIVCMNDGGMSLYFGEHGGVIGAGEHVPVREVGARVLVEAHRVRECFMPAAGLDKPVYHTMRFILVTKNGLLAAQQDTESLENGEGKLAPLGNLVQELITAIRAASEDKGL